jgi:hypothetical protein
MLKQVLLFSQGAAEALYNDQMITTLDVLQDLTNNIIKELCRSIRKPGGDGPGHQISKLSVSRLKLFAFWARHMWRTSRGVDDWTNRTYDKIKTLTNQKTLEDSLLDTKPPETPAMTLNLHLRAKAFTDMLILLGKMRGIAGHPLSYVPRPNLKGPNNADINDKETHIVDRHYSDAKFDQPTPAEKQRLWQLRNAGKTPGTGLTRCDPRRAVASTSTSSASSGSSSKCQMEDSAIKRN